MAKASYIGVTGVAKKDKKMYFGHAGVAKKVKKSYIGDADGKARLWFTSGNPYYAFSYRKVDSDTYLDMRDNDLNASEIKVTSGIQFSKQHTSTAENVTYFKGKYYALFVINTLGTEPRYLYESSDLSNWTESKTFPNADIALQCGLISDGNYMYVVTLASNTSFVYYYTNDGTTWTKTTISRDSSLLSGHTGVYDLQVIDGEIYYTVKSTNSDVSSFKSIVYKLNGSTKTKVTTISTQMSSPLISIDEILAYTGHTGSSLYMYYKNGTSFTSKKLGTLVSTDTYDIGVRKIGSEIWFIPHNMSTYVPLYYADSLSGTWTKKTPGMSIKDMQLGGSGDEYPVKDNSKYKGYVHNNLFYIYDITTKAMYYTSDFTSFTQVSYGENLFGINNAPKD